MVRCLPLPAALLDGAGRVVTANDGWLALGLAAAGETPRAEDIDALGRSIARSACDGGELFVLGGTARRDTAVQRHDDLLEALPVAAFLSTRDEGRFTDASAEAGVLAGLPRAELRGRTTVDVGFYSGEAARQVVLDESVRHEYALRNLVIEFSLPRGRMFGLVNAAACLLEGRTQHCSVVLDVTARGAEEAQLREQEEAYAAAFCAVPQPTLIFDSHIALVAANAAAECLLGRAALVEAGRPVPRPAMPRAADGKPLPTDQRPVRTVLRTREALHRWPVHHFAADGGLRRALVDATPLPRAHGKGLDVLLVFTSDESA
jgi:PAS domain-containing protein